MSAGILYWGLGGNAGPESILPLPADTASQENDVNPGLPAPSVFPENKSFNFSVLDKDLKLFREFVPLANDQNLLGREDPFRNY